MRVLAFEDSYDIEKILLDGGVDLIDWEILQYWNTMDCFERIENFQPDLLLLDHYIPPVKGLEVLRGLLELVAAEQIQRPKLILGISSSSEANGMMSLLLLVIIKLEKVLYKESLNPVCRWLV